MSSNSIYNLGCRVGYKIQRGMMHQGLKGNIKEVIAFDRTLSDSESNRMNKELMNKHITSSVKTSSVKTSSVKTSSVKTRKRSSPSKFMVLGGIGKLAYTKDGEKVSISKSGTEYFKNSSGEVRCIAFNGDQWIAGGTSTSGTKLARSNDGINWTRVDSLDSKGAQWASFNSCTWVGSQWMLTSDYNLGKYYKSTDGINWTQLRRVPGNVSQFAGDDSIIVACGVNVNMQGSAIYYSRDQGDTWTVAKSAQPFFVQNGGLYGLKYNGKMFVATGCGSASGAIPTLIYSYDGIKWKKADIPSKSRLWQAYWNGKMWICASQSDMIYSNDGINWKFTNYNINKTMFRPSIDTDACTWDGSSWHFASTYMTSVHSSRNGIEWSNRTANKDLSSQFPQGSLKAIVSANVLPWE
jgi:hypothetical protein